MKTTTTFVPIGNSRGVRIRRELLIRSGLKGNIELVAKPGEIRIIAAKPQPKVNVEALLSEDALSDWLRPEEDEAWKDLQPAA